MRLVTMTKSEEDKIQDQRGAEGPAGGRTTRGSRRARRAAAGCRATAAARGRPAGRRSTGAARCRVRPDRPPGRGRPGGSRTRRGWNAPKSVMRVSVPAGPLPKGSSSADSPRAVKTITYLYCSSAWSRTNRAAPTRPARPKSTPCTYGGVQDAGPRSGFVKPNSRIAPAPVSNSASGSSAWVPRKVGQAKQEMGGEEGSDQQANVLEPRRAGLGRISDNGWEARDRAGRGRLDRRFGAVACTDRLRATRRSAVRRIRRGGAAARRFDRPQDSEASGSTLLSGASCASWHALPALPSATMEEGGGKLMAEVREPGGPGW